MSVVFKAGVIVAVAVAVVSALFIATGLHQNTIVFGVGSLVIYILINVGVVYWALSQTAGKSGYGKQLINGLLIGVVGGAFVFLGSWLLMTLVFPNALDEIREATLAFMENSGMPPAMLEERKGKLERMTVVGQSLQGAIGTLLTSLIVGAIIGIFKRRK